MPHSYFTQFYIASVLSSVFWGIQLFSRGDIFQAIASRVSEEHRLDSMSLSQVMICWLLLAMQGSRRLWECVIFSKPSTSKMWFVHWLLGLGFYLAAAVAIWIEGSGMDTLYMVWCFIADKWVCRNHPDSTSHHRPYQDHKCPECAHFHLRSAFPDGLWHAARLPPLPLLIKEV